MLVFLYIHKEVLETFQIKWKLTKMSYFIILNIMKTISIQIKWCYNQNKWIQLTLLLFSERNKHVILKRNEEKGYQS